MLRTVHGSLTTDGQFCRYWISIKASIWLTENYFLSHPCLEAKTRAL